MLGRPKKHPLIIYGIEVLRPYPSHQNTLKNRRDGRKMEKYYNSITKRKTTTYNFLGLWKIF